MKGFKNIGNTCYLNSGLQMIVQNEALCQLINKYHKHSEILTKINNFIDEYYDSSKKEVIIPKEIKKIVEEKKALFEGYDQQDSTEFIIYLLDIIDEEIKKIHPESRGIQSLFGIKFNSRIKCKLRDCLKLYNTYEDNNFLLLDINSNSTSLDDAYHNFKSGVKLDSDNKYFCENCQLKRNASKRSTIVSWPQCLFIWLKRFKQNRTNISKNDQELDIPLKWRHNNYLQGAVIHYGSLHGGHYVYVGKNNNRWFLYNDSSVSEISNELELKNLLAKAYWLCYKSF